jgi:hypothetical protein
MTAQAAESNARKLAAEYAAHDRSPRSSGCSSANGTGPVARAPRATASTTIALVMAEGADSLIL